MAKQSVRKKKMRASQLAFLKVYRVSGNINRSCGASKVGRRTHYNWLADDAKYKTEFEEAKEDYIDKLEGEVDRRAFVGVDHPVFYQGVKVATVKTHSDALAMFRLKALAPTRYRERSELKMDGQVNHTGQVTLYLPDNHRDASNG